MPGVSDTADRCFHISSQMGGRFSCYQWRACLWRRKWRNPRSHSCWTSNCLSPSSCSIPKRCSEWSSASWPFSIGDCARSHHSISWTISSPSSHLLPLQNPSSSTGSSLLARISFSAPPGVIQTQPSTKLLFSDSDFCL